MSKTQLAAVAAELYARGWLLATGGNLSARCDDATFVMTASGGHKGRLQEHDFLVLSIEGDDAAAPRTPSAETAVHRALYRRGPARAVVHVHAPYATLVSRARDGRGFVDVSGYELVKALGFWAPGAVVHIPIVANHAEIPALASAVAGAADASARSTAPGCPAVLVAGHGIYAWGDAIAAAQRHVEAAEFLCHMAWEDGRGRPGTR